MNSFSASEAILAGWRVIRREPRAIFYWAAAYLALGVLPQWLFLAPALPELIAFYQEAARHLLEGGPAPSAESLAVVQRTTGMQPLSVLVTLIWQVVLTGAFYRAVLTPEDRRFGYLRLTRQELWLSLSLLALFALVMLAGVGAGVVAAIAVGVAVMGGGGMGWISGVFMIACFGVLAWIALRLSLAPVMSFAQSRFVLFESWALTRGQALKMFGVALAVFAPVLMFQLLLLAITWPLFVGVVSEGQGWRGMLDMAPDELARRVVPYLAVFAPLGAVIGVTVYALMMSPWAEIYRQSAGDAEPAPAA